MDVKDLAAGRVPVVNPFMVERAPRLRGVLALLLLLLVGFLVMTSNGLASPRVFASAHPRGLDFVNQSGRHFLVEDAYIANNSLLPFLGGSTIHLRYRATGITPPSGTGSASLPQPPTVIVAKSAGVSLTPTDSPLGGVSGMSTVVGDVNWHFQGTAPHHLRVSVVQVLGDTQASWSFDLDI